MASNPFRDLQTGLAAARRAGGSPNSVSSGGFPGASFIEQVPYLLAKITGLENDDDPDTNLPCYSYVLLAQRDPTLDTEQDGIQKILYEEDNAYTGDYASIDPNLLPGDPSAGCMVPAFELSGNTEVPVDGTAVVRLWPGKNHYTFEYQSSPLEEIFPVTLTSRLISMSDSLYDYAWTGVDDTSKTGTLSAHLVITQIQTHDGLNPDKYSLTIVGATGGTYTLTDSGGSASVPIVYNASASTVQAALIHFTVTGSAGSYVLTGAAGTNTGTGTGNTLTGDGTNLLPKKNHNPARFLDASVMDVPVKIWLKLRDGDDPLVAFSVKQRANDTSSPQKPMIFRLHIEHVIEGTYTATFDNGSPTAAIQFDATASQIQTALSAQLACTVVNISMGLFEITVTADKLIHTLKANTGGSTPTIFGTKRYRTIWSNGNTCTGAVAGVFPPSIMGWAGPPTPTVTISGGGSSIAGPWTLTSNLLATGGTYQITVDGGSPVSTSYTACPTISGFTTSGSVGACILTASSGSHTLLAFGALLTSSQPEQFVTISPAQCVVLVTPTNC